MDIDFEVPEMNHAVSQVMCGLLWDYMTKGCPQEGKAREVKTVAVFCWGPGVFGHPSFEESDTIPAKLYCLKHFLKGISQLEPVRKERIEKYRQTEAKIITDAMGIEIRKK